MWPNMTLDKLNLMYQINDILRHRKIFDILVSWPKKLNKEILKKIEIKCILIILAYVHTQRDDILIMVCKIERK